MSGELVYIHVTLGIRYTPHGPVIPFGFQRDNPDSASSFVQEVLREADREQPPTNPDSIGIY